MMSAVKEGCRKAFQAQPQRLMAAMYTCNIQVNAEVLGESYNTMILHIDTHSLKHVSADWIVTVAEAGWI
jgi:hypothetical protein